MSADPEPSPGSSLITSTSMLLIAAGRQCHDRMDVLLAEQHITLRHVGVLGHLSRQPDLSYSELGRRAHISAQAAHATVTRLIERGAVAAAEVKAGESAQLRVTDQGRALLAAAAAAATQVDAELIGPDHVAALRPGLLGFVRDLMTGARRATSKTRAGAQS